MSTELDLSIKSYFESTPVLLWSYLANNLTSDIFDNVSAAVTTLYKQLFPSSETKFSGPLIIGHDKPEINNQLLTDVIFCPFNCMYNKFTIFIYGIGVSSDDGMCNVVPKCLPEEWNIASKMEHLWNYHLRKCTLASYEFWTRSTNPTYDCENLQFLFDSGFLNPFPKEHCNDEYLFPALSIITKILEKGI
ncbi:12008_t:CDS:2 [Entrophospora sp. SA101]|nr:12008_t:CDS:2 [Entrophospora sp. SA101]